jgi:hypothetical protein
MAVRPLTDRGRASCSDRNLSKCYFIQRKSHNDGLKSKLGFRSERTVLEHRLCVLRSTAALNTGSVTADLQTILRGLVQTRTDT